MRSGKLPSIGGTSGRRSACVYSARGPVPHQHFVCTAFGTAQGAADLLLEAVVVLYVVVLYVVVLYVWCYMVLYVVVLCSRAICIHVPTTSACSQLKGFRAPTSCSLHCFWHGPCGHACQHTRIAPPPFWPQGSQLQCRQPNVGSGN